jgi:hypothetical protein
MAQKSAAPIQKVCPTNVRFQKKASNIDLIHEINAWIQMYSIQWDTI